LNVGGPNETGSRGGSPTFLFSHTHPRKFLLSNNLTSSANS
jgi:hypothetical protein